YCVAAHLFNVTAQHHRRILCHQFEGVYDFDSDDELQWLIEIQKESVELQEFSLGSCPPSVGLQGMRWSTIVDQRVLKLGLDWDTNEMSILMFAKLAKPLIETVGIVINSLHIKLLFTPILDGKALLYSFVS
ncbi:hypothetical protein HN51_036121, partial [Arachis hypogaea]